PSDNVNLMTRYAVLKSCTLFLVGSRTPRVSQLFGLNSFASLHASLVAFAQNQVSDMLK
ncbi:hypothetical protein CRM22_010963, partial [Opisthorchis felineus]